MSKLIEQIDKVINKKGSLKTPAYYIRGLLIDIVNYFENKIKIINNEIIYIKQLINKVKVTNNSYIFDYGFVSRNKDNYPNLYDKPRLDYKFNNNLFCIRATKDVIKNIYIKYTDSTISPKNFNSVHLGTSSDRNYAIIVAYYFDFNISTVNNSNFSKIVIECIDGSTLIIPMIPVVNISIDTTDVLGGNKWNVYAFSIFQTNCEINLHIPNNISKLIVNKTIYRDDTIINTYIDNSQFSDSVTIDHSTDLTTLKLLISNGK